MIEPCFRERNITDLAFTEEEGAVFAQSTFLRTGLPLVLLRFPPLSST